MHGRTREVELHIVLSGKTCGELHHDARPFVVGVLAEVTREHLGQSSVLLLEGSGECDRQVLCSPIIEEQVGILGSLECDLARIHVALGGFIGRESLRATIAVGRGLARYLPLIVALSVVDTHEEPLVGGVLETLVERQRVGLSHNDGGHAIRTLACPVDSAHGPGAIALGLALVVVHSRHLILRLTGHGGQRVAHVAIAHVEDVVACLRGLDESLHGIP